MGSRANICHCLGTSLAELTARGWAARQELRSSGDYPANSDLGKHLAGKPTNCETQSKHFDRGILSAFSASTFCIIAVSNFYSPPGLSFPPLPIPVVEVLAAARRTLSRMAQHNIVVFGGDHCGPEVRPIVRWGWHEGNRMLIFASYTRSLPRVSRWARRDDRRAGQRIRH